MLSGPRGVGKSYLLDAMMSGEHPAAAAVLGLGDLAAWRRADRAKLRSASRRAIHRLVLHHDIVGSHGVPFPTASAQDVAGWIAAAQCARVVTMWAPADVLARRLARREHGRRHGPRRRAVLLAVLALYADPRSVADVYRRWARACAASGTPTWWMDASVPDPCLRPPSALDEVLASV